VKPVCGEEDIEREEEVGFVPGDDVAVLGRRLLTFARVSRAGSAPPLNLVSETAN
jgi:hypothetical protein